MSIAPEIQSLFDFLFAQAHAALQTNRSFAPFAATDWADGQRTQSTADMPVATSEPGEHLGALLAVLADQAKGGAVKAAGLAFDAAGLEIGDAVCVHLETADDAVQILVPYRRGALEAPDFGEPIVQDVVVRIFPR